MEVEMVVLRLQALVAQREIAVDKLSKIDDSISEAVNAYVDSISISDLDLQRKIYPEFSRWINKALELKLSGEWPNPCKINDDLNYIFNLDEMPIPPSLPPVSPDDAAGSISPADLP
jgi:hypothetical protein